MKKDAFTVDKIKNGSQGKGVDRHLFALLCMAEKQKEEAEAAAAGTGDGGETSPPGRPPPLGPPPRTQGGVANSIPALFDDEAWRVMNHVILSTR